MKIKDVVSMTLDGMKQRKLRVSLNVLGIVIGISAITALLSISRGMSMSITEQTELLGPTTITVSPRGFMGPAGESGGGGRTLTLRDVDRIRDIPGVVIATPVVTGSAEIKVGGYSASATVVGVVPEEYLRIHQYIDISEGRFLRLSDRVAAMLGVNIAHPPNEEEPIAHIGSRITLTFYIDGEERTWALRVAGILAEVGASMFGSPDDQVFVSLRTAQQIFHTGNTVNQIVVEAQSKEVVEDLAEEIQDKMGEDVMVLSATFILETIGSMTSIINVTLGGIAAISLIVAGIGVINTMMISVMERTREIGVMKALGAKNRSVLLIFLTEASLTGLLGGVLGASFGFLLSQIISVIAGFTVGIPLTPAPSIELGAVSVGFAVATGTLAGLYPARKAAKLDPVEALRYE